MPRRATGPIRLSHRPIADSQDVKPTLLKPGLGAGLTGKWRACRSTILGVLHEGLSPHFKERLVEREFYHSRSGAFNRSRFGASSSNSTTYFAGSSLSTIHTAMQAGHTSSQSSFRQFLRKGSEFLRELSGKLETLCRTSSLPINQL
jgi:hypothetical protein